jgi:hypothetical protein
MDRNYRARGAPRPHEPTYMVLNQRAGRLSRQGGELRPSPSALAREFEALLPLVRWLNHALGYRSASGMRSVRQ